MEKRPLQIKEHDFKVGDVCPATKANVRDDALLTEDGQVIGLYLSDARKYSLSIGALLALANAEFLSDRVPKSNMTRSAGIMDGYSKDGKRGRDKIVEQYSTILGAVPPRPHMRRPYPTMSSVHSVKTARTFVRAMLALAQESQKIIAELAPSLSDEQASLFEQVPDKWKFGGNFTSSISNYNISANYHRDTGNIVGAVNVILVKKNGVDGGQLNVPDYGATFEQPDCSMLVYPAWKSLHGVTPITTTRKDGYRNSFIFYPLKAFAE
tara:strand:+ start:6422 stop:7222 length:801 start_codon:yes stop_codon:yes gene_type:complete